MTGPRAWQQQGQVEVGGAEPRGQPLAEVAEGGSSGREACEEQLIQGRDGDAGECVYQIKKKVLS